MQVLPAVVLFLSTSPLRGTTAGAAGVAPVSRISIHVPLAGDDAAERRCRDARKVISIHVPLAGYDLFSGFLPLFWRTKFLSTSPLRGTTPLNCLSGQRRNISIHVPLAGDDMACASRTPRGDAFLSTSPLRGTTAQPIFINAKHAAFLSTSPLRGTTLAVWRAAKAAKFLSTSPLRGTTCGNCCLIGWRCAFLSTSPLRGTTGRAARMVQCRAFLSTSPLRGTTAYSLMAVASFEISIHVPLAGDDRHAKL